MLGFLSGYSKIEIVRRLQPAYFQLLSAQHFVYILKRVYSVSEEKYMYLLFSCCFIQKLTAQPMTLALSANVKICEKVTADRT